MSFLAYMMGRGLYRKIAAGGETAAIDAALARRGCGALEEDGANLAFEAETRGHLELAGDLYKRVLDAGYFPRWAAQRAASVAAARGDFAGAISAYRTLENNHPRHGFIHANLMLAYGDAQAAAILFGDALAQSLSLEAIENEFHAEENPVNNSDRSTAEIESLLDAGTQLLKTGNYAGARRTLERALSTVDLLMGGQSGWIVAETKAAGAESPNVGPTLVETLLPLVKMSDLLLRLLARTCLASNLASVLRKRELSEDVAVSAAGADEIDELLRREHARMSRVAAEHPGHAEAHYHLGLLCRALGDLPAAAAAFHRVLAIAPYYTRAAARLAVTLMQMGQAEKSPAVLARAFDVPADALLKYYRLALSATDAEKFDRTAESAARSTESRANLAFALGEVGLLDDVRREWKESPLPAAK